MAKIARSLLFLSLLITSTFSPVTAQACSNHQFPDHKTFAACNDLPVLNSTIYWNYFPSNATVDLAFRTTLLGESRWTAWAINPSSKGMVGSQALVAFQRTDGSMAAYTSPIMSYSTHLEQGNLTFPVYNLSAVYKDKQITIFASLGLPNNATTVNQLWQQGLLQGNTPGMHPMAGPYLKSFGTLDFLSGKVEATAGTPHSLMSRLKNAHGIINTVSFGILFPAGAFVARNFKVFGPVWFDVHKYCQTSGSAGGAAGFATGIILHYLSGIGHKGHKCIGWTLLVLVILQVVVGYFFRPEKESKNRWLWNLFHYVGGYTVVILGIVNTFKGFDILEVSKSLRYAYIGYLAFTVFVGVVGEAFTQWNNKRMAQAAKTQPEQRADGTV